MRIGSRPLGFLILALFFTAALAEAQPGSDKKIDSLRSAIDSMTDDSLRVWTLEKLERQLVLKTDYTGAFLAAKEMLDLAKATDQHKAYATAQAHVAYCHYFLGDYRSALEWAQKASVSAEKWLDSMHVSTCYGNAGLVFQDMGEYDSSLVYLLKCLDIRQQLQDTVHWSYSHYDVAELFIELGDYDQAIFHHQKALELRKQIPHLVDQYNVIEDSYSALAMAHHRDGDPDKAIELLSQSLRINQKKRDKKREAASLRKLATVYFDQGEFLRAKENLLRSVDLDASIHDVENVAETKILLGRTYHRLKLYDQAIATFEEVLDLAKRMNSLPRLVEANKQLAVVYASAGQYEKAYEYQRKSTAGKDSLINDQKVKALKEMEVRYETAKREAEIDELAAQKELADLEAARKSAEARQSRNLLLASGMTMLLLIGLIGLVVRSYYNGRKTNAKLQLQKQEIEEKSALISNSLREKDVLLREIHHRVKNNLQVISSLLNLQSASLSDQAALDAIKEGQNRVKSIALIHQKLYQTEDLSRVNFKEYADQLTSFLAATFKLQAKKISIHVEANNIEFDIDTAVPLGLIINELVTNAYKYAFQNQDLGEIHVAVKPHPKGFELTVRDNGMGVPEDLNISQSKSLGMKLVHILSRQLRGSVQWQNNGGACFRVQFSDIRAKRQSA